MKKNGLGEKYEKRSGSSLVGIIILLLMITSITMAAVYRTQQVAVVVTDTANSFSAYQNSDGSAEEVMNSVRVLDSADQDGYIPENKPASIVCSGKVQCFKNATNVIASTYIDILRLRSSGDDANTQRAVDVSLPKRLRMSIPPGSFRVEPCSLALVAEGKCSVPNQCDVLVQWNDVPVNDDQYDDNTTRAAGYEIRMSTQDSLETDPTTTADRYGWRKAPGTDDLYDEITTTNRDYFHVKNAMDSNLPASQYGNTYYFAIKLKNSRTFEFDSPYTTGTSDHNEITLPSGPDCSGPAVVDPDPGVNGGCTISPALGTVQAKTFSYSCCNGSGCYVPQLGWKPGDDGSCAVEECSASDEAINCAPGGKTSCVPGESDCNYIYKQLGFCNESGGCDSGWKLDQYRDIRPGDLTNNTSRAKCCTQDCSTWTKPSCSADPANGHYVNNHTCTENACGTYTQGGGCTLVCDTGFYKANINGTDMCVRDCSWCAIAPDRLGCKGTAKTTVATGCNPIVGTRTFTEDPAKCGPRPSPFSPSCSTYND